MNERDIFVAAIEKTNGEERAAFLERACGDDAQLRARIDSLIAEHCRNGSFFLDSPAVGISETVDHPDRAQRLSEQIGDTMLMRGVGRAE